MAPCGNNRAIQSRGHFLSALFLCAATIASAAPPTSITLDGSLGPAGNVNASSPHLFSITPAMGRSVGANLFQSFGTFNVGTGDVASFSANAGTQNIIARVTGGSASTIDGTLASPVNLFFLNPAGVMFTANAQVDVTGSFVVSTANYAKLADGTFFYADTAHPSADAGLTAAPVSAFGFLTSTPQAVSFLGSQITTPTGAGFDVIAGDISLNGATLLAPGGILTLFSAASAGEVPFSLSNAMTLPGTGYANAPFSQFGAINITNQSQAEIDGNGGGSLVIRGGKITVDHSYVTSGNSGAVTGGNVAVTASQLSVTGGALIATDGFSTGQVGAVNVNVSGALEVSGSDSSGNHSEIFANVEQQGAPGAAVTVNAGSVDLNNGVISANTNGAGNAGSVNVTAGSMTMESDGRLSAISNGAGDAGSVNLTLTGSLSMSDTSGIIANTYSSANGGNISVTASQINLTGQALISANTDFGSGNAGNITVQSSLLSIQGTGAQVSNAAGITANSLTTSPTGGGAGVISVNSAMISLSNGAVISTSNQYTGNGGNIVVNSSQIQLSGGSSIKATSYNRNGGPVQITATESLSITGESTISTSSGQSGGAITLAVGQLLYLLDGTIAAYAGTNPNIPMQTLMNIHGGNINIDPDFIVLDNSLISANDLSGFGHDGNIVNTANFFFTDSSTLHATGTIDTTSPDLDLAGSLAALPVNLVDGGKQLRERCESAVNHEFSTFIAVGRGGVENAPDELLPEFGVNPHLAAPGAGDATLR